MRRTLALLLLVSLALIASLTLLACDPGPSSTEDAGMSAEDAGPATPICDPKVVTCDEVAPTCPPGYVPEVTGGCWDVCIAQIECAPIPCEEAGPEPQCPEMWGCIPGGTCAPPR